MLDRASSGQSENHSSTSAIMSCLSYIHQPIKNVGKGLKVLNAMVNMAYYIAQAYDIFTANDGPDKNVYAIGLSLNALIAGGIGSPIFMAGTIFAHYIVNTIDEHLKAHATDDRNDQSDSDGSYLHLPLPWWEIILFIFDCITHTVDNAGTPLMMCSLALPDASIPEKIISQCIATLAGIIAPQDDLEECWKNIRFYNKIKSQSHLEQEEKEAAEPEPEAQILADVRQAISELENPDSTDVEKIVKAAQAKLGLFAANHAKKLEIKIEPLQTKPEIKVDPPQKPKTKTAPEEKQSAAPDDLPYHLLENLFDAEVSAPTPLHK